MHGIQLSDNANVTVFMRIPARRKQSSSNPPAISPSRKIIDVHRLASNEAYGWHFQYLTIIGLTLSTLAFAAGLLADLILSPCLFLFKNLLSICCAPLEVLISVLYWGLRLVRSLVAPAAALHTHLTDCDIRLIRNWSSPRRW